MAKSLLPTMPKASTEVLANHTIQGVGPVTPELLNAATAGDKTAQAALSFSGLDFNAMASEVFAQADHARREVDRIALHINGGREAGYRAWTRKQRFPTDAAGRWQVKVLTESEQLLGTLRFRVTE